MSRRDFLGGAGSALVVASALAAPAALPAAAEAGAEPLASSGYFRHIFFENSLEADRYYYSEGSFSDQSWLRLMDGKLPVESEIFFTPPNALRLQWRSHGRGQWQATLLWEPWRNRDPRFVGEVLRFWAYSPKVLPGAALPRLQASDAEGGFSGPLDLAAVAAAGVPAGRWFQFEIPLERFASVSVLPFNPLRLRSLSFLQGAADEAEHTLILDEFTIEPVRARVQARRRRRACARGDMTGTSTWCGSRWIRPT